MAKMVPPHGPKSNDSYTAEPVMYRALQRLSDEYTVIHSLPWLGGAAREITGNRAITGEIDFLVLHPALGILAIEVKGGKLRYDQGQFVLKNGQKIDPIAQVRKGVHTLARWIKGAGGPALRIGYAIAFPESSVQGRLIPPALVDMTQGKPENICIDRLSLSHIGQRVEEVMRYWHRNGITWNMGKQKIDQVTRLICPVEDYSLNWMERIEEDNQKWLMLTDNQARYLQRLTQRSRTLITGRSGTGKTLLATTRARQLASQGKRVLFVVYNVQLAIIVKKDLAGTNVVVGNFHQLCRKASSLLRKPVNAEDKDWFKTEGPNNFKQAVNKKLLPSFDALIIDEAQVFAHDWLMSLTMWFSGKPILACCDETQVFEYEHHSTAKEISRIINAGEPFLLTENIRSPRAVFERLETLIPASYAQQSPRPEEPDALQEFVETNSQHQLQQTIEMLHQQGIPPKSIMVIYFHSKPWLPPSETEKLTEKFVGQVISVYRCRGLEAPIVLVWADEEVDDNLLLCAYSRATSRCIVFYNLRSFVQNKENEHLSPLQYAVSESINLDNRLAAMFPIEKSFDFQEIVTDPIKTYWSPLWRGWIIKRDTKETYTQEVIRGLFIEHIRVTSTFPVYVVYDINGLTPGTFMYKYRPVLALKKCDGDNEENKTSLRLLWCKDCTKWTPHTADKQECTTCNTISDPSKNANNNVICKEETIFMIMLKQWVALETEQSLRIHFNVSGFTDGIYPASKLFSGMYILSTNVGQNVGVADVFADSLRRCPWLKDHVDFHVWQQNINMSLSKWKDHGWLEKLAKGKYKRKEFPPLSGWHLRMFDRSIEEEYEEIDDHPF